MDWNSVPGGHSHVNVSNSCLTLSDEKSVRPARIAKDAPRSATPSTRLPRSSRRLTRTAPVSQLSERVRFLLPIQSLHWVSAKDRLSALANRRRAALGCHE